MSDNAAAYKRPGPLGDKALLALAARFLVYLAALLAVIEWLAGRTHFVADIEGATVAIATSLMGLTGVVATGVGHFINIPGRQLLIGPDCTGLKIAAMLVALVLAYPVRLSSKAIGVLVGVLVVLSANIARLVAIAHFSSAPDIVFYGAHDFLFQVGLVAVAVAVWVRWLSFARARES